MAFYNKNEDKEQNIIQYRFTAYLKTSIAHQKAKYLAELLDRQRSEISYEEYAEILNRLQNGNEDTYLRNEINDDQLAHALNGLKERDRIVVFRRAVSGESFVKIAMDMRMKYVTVKAIYRRSLEKLRKEMLRK